MSDSETNFPSYGFIWRWLVGLLLAGLVVTYLPVGKPLAITLILTAALVKAFLVARHYMHMRSETVLIFAIAVIPVLLLIMMALTLVPDIIFGR